MSLHIHKMDDFFDEPFTAKDIPDVEELYVGECFSYPLQELISPNLKILHLHNKYKKLLYNTGGKLEVVDLKNVEELHFDDNFNEPLIYLNLSKVKRLYISNNYNILLNASQNFDSLEELYLGNDYNYDIKQLKFPKLQILHLGRSFDSDINSECMPLLEELVCGFYFNKELKNFKLQRLLFSKMFNQSIAHLNVSQLEILQFGDDFDQPLVDQNKKALNFANLKILRLGEQFNQSLFDQDGNPINLCNVKDLRFGSKFDKPLINSNKQINLSNVETLHFGTRFNQHLCPLPKIKTLILGDYFGKSIEELDLSELEELHINCKFINRSLHKLKKIHLGNNCTKLSSFMPNVEEMSIARDFATELTNIFLPNLKKLFIDPRFDENKKYVYDKLRDVEIIY